MRFVGHNSNRRPGGHGVCIDACEDDVGNGSELGVMWLRHTQMAPHQNLLALIIGALFLSSMEKNEALRKRETASSKTAMFGMQVLVWECGEAARFIRETQEGFVKLCIGFNSE